MAQINGLTLKDLIRERKSEHEEGCEIDVEPIREILADDMPELDGGPVGRVRLVGALMRKFGKGFKSVPMALRAIEHYDKESAMVTVIKRNRGLRNG